MGVAQYQSLTESLHQPPSGYLNPQTTTLHDCHNSAPCYSPLSDMEFDIFESFSEASSCDLSQPCYDTHDVQTTSSQTEKDADDNDSEVQQTDDDESDLSEQEDLDPKQGALDSSWNGVITLIKTSNLLFNVTKLNENPSTISIRMQC